MIIPDVTKKLGWVVVGSFSFYNVIFKLDVKTKLSTYMYNLKKDESVVIFYIYYKKFLEIASVMP